MCPAQFMFFYFAHFSFSCFKIYNPYSAHAPRVSAFLNSAISDFDSSGRIREKTSGLIRRRADSQSETTGWVTPHRSAQATSVRERDLRRFLMVWAKGLGMISPLPGHRLGSLARQVYAFAQQLCRGVFGVIQFESLLSPFCFVFD